MGIAKGEAPGIPRDEGLLLSSPAEICVTLAVSALQEIPVVLRDVLPFPACGKPRIGILEAVAAGRFLSQALPAFLNPEPSQFLGKASGFQHWVSPICHFT